MNFLDFLIIIPLAWFSYKGFKNGFVMEVVYLVSILAGIYVALRFSDWVGSHIGITGENASIIAFAVTFFAVIIGVYFLGKAIETLLKKLSLGLLNHIGGLLVGLFKTALIIGLLIFFWNKIDSKQNIIKPTTRDHSLLFRPMEKLSYSTWPMLNTINNKVKSL